MKVKQLINTLSAMPQDAEVGFLDEKNADDVLIGDVAVANSELLLLIPQATLTNETNEMKAKHNENKTHHKT